MEKGVVKLVVLNGEDFNYWKNRTRLVELRMCYLGDCTNKVCHHDNS
jgi:hypothetical protein